MLIHWIVLTLALLIVSHLYSGLRVANLPAAIVAAAGRVNTQAMPISRATPQRTAESRRVLPTPITDPSLPVCWR